MPYHPYRSYRLYRPCRLFILCTLLTLLTACTSASQQAVLVPTTPTTTSSAALPSTNVAPTAQATTSAPPVQQSLPKGLLKSGYPVLDWVFNATCAKAVNSYANSPMDTALAYDSAAWLYPNDGHLVEGWQDCDRAAMIQQARSQGLPALLTIGVDSYWSSQALAQYINQAASQPQAPCSAQATTYICTIVNWAVTGGYTGVIIDFESVNANYPHIRTLFATFMQELQNALHRQGLLCGIALIHKISDQSAVDPSFSGNSFEDWKLLSGTDFLVDMVLDLDLSLNKPGPLTSIPWLDQNLTYIWRTVPQALSKIIFEFPLYGRLWQQDSQGAWHPTDDETCAQVSTQKASQSLLSDVNTDPTTPEIAWNDQNGLRQEVWYDTSSSLLAIMTHLQNNIRSLLNDPQYRLPTSFWYRGSECSDFFGIGNVLQTFYRSS